MGNFYLLAYNLGLCLAWGYILNVTLDITLLQKGTTSDVYKSLSLPLQIAQTAAVMEIVHSVLGIVRSPVFITATQVASRLFIVWGIIWLVPGPTTSSALTLYTVPNGVKLELSLVTLLVAWSASEVIRYSFYAFKELFGTVPYFSQWLRYTGFILLYPLGVASELTMVYLAYPTIKAKELLAYKMPNKFNISFDYALACVVVSVLYLPGLPMLYKYMLVQRSKVLGKKGKKTEKQA